MVILTSSQRGSEGRIARLGIVKTTTKQIQNNFVPLSTVFDASGDDLIQLSQRESIGFAPLPLTALRAKPLSDELVGPMLCEDSRIERLSHNGLSVRIV